MPKLFPRIVALGLAASLLANNVSGSGFLVSGSQNQSITRNAFFAAQALAPGLPPFGSRSLARKIEVRIARTIPFARPHHSKNGLPWQPSVNQTREFIQFLRDHPDVSSASTVRAINNRWPNREGLLESIAWVLAVPELIKNQIFAEDLQRFDEWMNRLSPSFQRRHAKIALAHAETTEILASLEKLVAAEMPGIAKMKAPQSMASFVENLLLGNDSELPPDVVHAWHDRRNGAAANHLLGSFVLFPAGGWGAGIVIMADAPGTPRRSARILFYNKTQLTVREDALIPLLSYETAMKVRSRILLTTQEMATLCGIVYTTLQDAAIRKAVPYEERIEVGQTQKYYWSILRVDDIKAILLPPEGYEGLRVQAKRMDVPYHTYLAMAKRGDVLGLKRRKVGKKIYLDVPILSEKEAEELSSRLRTKKGYVSLMTVATKATVEPKDLFAKVLLNAIPGVLSREVGQRTYYDFPDRYLKHPEAIRNLVYRPKDGLFAADLEQMKIRGTAKFHDTIIRYPKVKWFPIGEHKIPYIKRAELSEFKLWLTTQWPSRSERIKEKLWGNETMAHTLRAKLKSDFPKLYREDIRKIIGPAGIGKKWAARVVKTETRTVLFFNKDNADLLAAAVVRFLKRSG